MFAEILRSNNISLGRLILKCAIYICGYDLKYALSMYNTEICCHKRLHVPLIFILSSSSTITCPCIHCPGK